MRTSIKSKVCLRQCGSVTHDKDDAIFALQAAIFILQSRNGTHRVTEQRGRWMSILAPALSHFAAPLLRELRARRVCVILSQADNQSGQKAANSEVRAYVSHRCGTFNSYAHRGLRQWHAVFFQQCSRGAHVRVVIGPIRQWSDCAGLYARGPQAVQPVQMRVCAGCGQPLFEPRRATARCQLFRQSPARAGHPPVGQSCERAALAQLERLWRQCCQAVRLIPLCPAPLPRTPCFRGSV